MSDIKFLIQHEQEGTKLDFKREQYRKEKYKDLIKDIMAMANAPVEGKRYIVTGVKDLPSGTKEYFSIPEKEFVDQATYQQIVRENVEPSIDFSYYPIEVEGNLLGVFEIDNCINPPYMMKKNSNGLNKGDCFVRRGSQQERMTRRDLDEILAFKSKFQFNGKIAIGFNKKLDKKITIDAAKDAELPSQEVRKKIEAILEERRFKEKFGLNTIDLLGLRTSLYTESQSLPHEERSTETLRRNLEEVDEKYYEHDMFHIGEELSEKLNLVLRNDGDEYLEDVSIEFKIPSSCGVKVMDRIYRKPVSAIERALVTTTVVPVRYPHVKEVEEFFIIESTIDNLKHHQYTEAFGKALRIFFGPNTSNQVITCLYTIYAKNLPSPIFGELEIEVV
ncbi:TPA: ATP-binding protein [Bacillus paranthracis]|uniref:ATP-binding protein n=1 Tax=Bacillus sp. ME5 TaxID=2744251 RepID=UPI0015F61249|nr:ATP-binding protein [Bacillus sp. ME5]